MSKENDASFEIICPSIQELSTIINQVRCKECNIVFCSESQLRMHDLKTHQKKNLDKSHKENVRFHCPVQNCVYALSNKYFRLYKYLKQHYLKVHAEKTHKCTLCEKSFSTNAAREAHIRICGINFECQCQKTFTSYEALLTHAKRNTHQINEKYKSKRTKSNKKIKIDASTPCLIVLDNQNVILPRRSVNVPILPKPTCNVSVQTEESQIKKKSSPKVKRLNSQVCRHTQTIEKEKQSKKSTETQTTKAVPRLIRVRQVERSKKISSKKNPISKEEMNLVQTLASEYLLPNSPYQLRQDIILEDLWEEKSTSGTQTSPEKNTFGDIEDYSNFTGISRSDPMLNEDMYANKFSSIETQTEKAYCRSIFESDNNETQTTDNFEPLHIYNNTCTQTCEEILSSDLGLSDIQTQTAWNHLDESTVSTETQTKAFKCLSGCGDSTSWFATQTNHMETQTDLFNIFDALQ